MADIGLVVSRHDRGANVMMVLRALEVCHMLVAIVEVALRVVRVYI